MRSALQICSKRIALFPESVYKEVMAYALHQELTDGTCDDAFIRYPSKRVALRIARDIAKRPAFMVANILVCDADDLTIARFGVPQE